LSAILWRKALPQHEKHVVSRPGSRTPADSRGVHDDISVAALCSIVKRDFEKTCGGGS
jgi:hypothetical protein